MVAIYLSMKWTHCNGSQSLCHPFSVPGFDILSLHLWSFNSCNLIRISMVYSDWFLTMQAYSWTVVADLSGRQSEPSPPSVQEITSYSYIEELGYSYKQTYSPPPHKKGQSVAMHSSLNRCTATSLEGNWCMTAPISTHH